jgi:hypothetical protein
MECTMMAQFDRGAVPSMIITRRAPTPVQGIGGVITVTEEYLLFIRIAGHSMRPGISSDEGLFGVRCLVARECPVPLLISSVTMENCGFINNDPIRETTFGNANTFIHMTRKWEAWEDVRLMLRMEPECTALRATVQDILLRTGHMNSQQLAETVPNLPQADRETLADLLAHMAQVQDEVIDHIHN